MATSIDDLLTVIDHHSRDASTLAGDAARALAWTSRSLTLLRPRDPEPDIERTRDAMVRRLADACGQAGIAFEPGAGRAGDLAAAVSDAVGLLRRDLTDDDRWMIATRLAAPARRWAGAIACSGPYAQVPQLLGVADRVRELSRTAAQDPPDARETRSIHAPIPGAERVRVSSPHREVGEELARLVAELRSHSRDLLTVRELGAVCHVATRVAAYVESPAHNPVPVEGARAAWMKARGATVLYADVVPRARGSLAAVVRHALRVDDAVRLAEQSHLPLSPPQTRRVARLLQHAAHSCAAELGRIHQRLIVPHGPRPLREERVGEWLRHERFAVRWRDLEPAVVALNRASNLPVTDVPPGPSSAVVSTPSSLPSADRSLPVASI